MKSWIVYLTENGKVDAIEDDHDKAPLWVFNKRYTIVGYPVFKHKQDAIDYIKRFL